MKGCEGPIPRRQDSTVARLFLVSFLLSLACVSAVGAAGQQNEGGRPGTNGFDTAEVIVDGRVILTVRGISAFPAERRAREIEKKIVAVADDESIPSGDVKIETQGDRTVISAGEHFLLDLFDEDADLEGISRQVLAETAQLRLREAITDYRLDRSPRVLMARSLYALGATLVGVGLFFGLRKGFRSLDSVVERRLQDHLKALEKQSARLSRRSSWPSSFGGSSRPCTWS